MSYTITTERHGMYRQTIRYGTLAEVCRALSATGADWTLEGLNGEGGGTIRLPGTTITVRRETA